MPADFSAKSAALLTSRIKLIMTKRYSKTNSPSLLTSMPLGKFAVHLFIIIIRPNFGHGLVRILKLRSINFYYLIENEDTHR